VWGLLFDVSVDMANASDARYLGARLRGILDGHVDFSDVSIVMPAMNEARNLPHVFERLPDGIHELLLVDGASTDDTVAVAQDLLPTVKIVRQTRLGKGNALACGFAAASGDIIVMIDADGSTDPAEAARFVSELRAGADFAKGTRFSLGGGSSDITRLRRVGNRFLNRLVNTIYGTAFTDLCYGYNAFWRHCLPAIGLAAGDTSGVRLWGDGFEVETLINIRIARAGLRVAEVGSFERSRMHGVSNLNAFADGLRVLRTIAAERRRVCAEAVPVGQACTRVIDLRDPELASPWETLLGDVEPVQL
jgi:glycosyltransferase involved in cell wall biosynthesis